MYARILRMQLKKDKIVAASDLFKKSVVPLCKKQEGFEGAFYMTNARTGEGLALTLWADEKAMLGTEQNRFFQDQVAKFLQFYALPPIREAYEVILKAEIEQPQKSKR